MNNNKLVGIVIDPGHPSYLFPSAWYNKYKSIK